MEVDISKELEREELNDGLKSISDSIVSSVTDAVSKLIDSDSKKEYFDKELVKVIATGFTKLALELKSKEKESVDLSPMINIASEISSQNKAILTMLPQLQSEPTDFSGLEKSLMIIVEQNTKMMNLIMNQPKPIDKKPTEWEMEVSEREYNGGIKKVKLISK